MSAGVCPFRCSGPSALQFAAKVVSPSTLSFLSAAWKLVESFKTFSGILRYMRRARSAMRPVKPRYVSVFDINILFRFLESLGPIKDGSLEVTRMRCIILLRIDLICRSADLGSVHYGTVALLGKDDSYTLRLGYCRNKVWVAGKPDYTWHVVRSYIRDSFTDWRRVVLSSPHNVLHYLSLTRSLRPSPLSGLFLKLSGPDPIGTQRIASIARQAMQTAGVDSKFRPHSIRAAAATKAYFLGVSVRVIRVRGNWASDEVFFTWYVKNTGGLDPQPADSSLGLEKALRQPWEIMFSQSSDLRST